MCPLWQGYILRNASLGEAIILPTSHTHIPIWWAPELHGSAYFSWATTLCNILHTIEGNYNTVVI